MDKKRVKELAKQYGVSEDQAKKIYKTMADTADDHTENGYVNITAMAEEAIIADDPEDEELYFDLAVVISDDLEK